MWSRGSRMLFIILEYSSFKFSEWDWYNILFRGYCQSCSMQKAYETWIPVTRMGFAVAGRCHSCITLSTSHTGRKKDSMALHIYTHISHIASSCYSISIFPMKITPPIPLSDECNCITCHHRILSRNTNSWPDTDNDLMRGARCAPISSQISAPIPGLRLRKYSYNQNLQLHFEKSNEEF